MTSAFETQPGLTKYSRKEMVLQHMSPTLIFLDKIKFDFPLGSEMSTGLWAGNLVPVAQPSGGRNRVKEPLEKHYNSLAN